MRYIILAALALTFTLSAKADYQYVGIGLTIHNDKQFQIVDIMKAGPADKAGILVGEYIFKVNGVSTAKMKFDKLVDTIRLGDPGSSVILDLGNKEGQNLRTVTAYREVLSVPCFVEGSLNLSFAGTPQNGTLSGWIGNQSINMNVFNSRASGILKGESLTFDITGDATYGNFTLEGWIHSQYVRWPVYGGHISGVVSCIP